MNFLKAWWFIATFLALVLPFGERVAALEPNPGSPGAVAPDAARTAAPSQTARIIVKYRDNAQARMATPQSTATSAQVLSQRAGIALQHLRVAGGNTQILTLDAPRSEDEVR